jgi:predicted ATP-grasp superfamily ATP-dependent carboligase
VEAGLRACKPIKVILSSASASGTIAAVRCLGASGYEVGVLFSSFLSAAAWSRYAKSKHAAPRENEPARFLDRLMQIGAGRPGQILLPTSDETAWLYSENADLLAQRFCVYQPPIETIRRILDKAELAAAATSVSIAVPPTWDPAKIPDLPQLAATLPYPLLIKPRTHVHRVGNDKGVIVHSQEQLMRALPAIIDREIRSAADGPLLAEARTPLLQKFIGGGQSAVSITGFLDRSGELFVTRRGAKVFQRLRDTGVGVCFESLPADAELSEAVRRLCRELGYFGVFEVEFIWSEGRWALIDFNPRLFNQVGMDIRRAMPLPLFACLDAMGETAALREAVERAKAYDQRQPTAIYDGFTLRAILLAQSLRGGLSSAEREYWGRWMRLHADHAVDFVADHADWVPGIVHAVSETYLGLKAIPRFLGSTRRVSAAAPRIAKRPS